MMKKTWLVTGGCGFIGSHLVDKLLDEGGRVLVLDNLSTGKISNLASPAELIIGDICDRKIVNKLMQRVDGCFHMAAVVSVEQSGKEWVKSHIVNQTGTIEILNAAKSGRNGKPVPLVYASSAAVYGNNPDLPLKESLKVSPLTAYGADKLGCELHARVGWEVFKIPSIGFRFFNVYGSRVDPDNMYSGVIAKFQSKISQSEPIIINGDGSQTRDFVYVDDVVVFLCKGMQRLMQSGSKAEVFNVCTGRQTSIITLSEYIGEILEKPVEKKYAPEREGDILHSRGSPEKAEKVLDLRTAFSLREGLDAYLNAEVSAAPKIR